MIDLNEYSKYEYTYKGFNGSFTSNKFNLKIGSFYKIDADIVEPLSSHFEGGFDYQKYLKNNLQMYPLKINSIEYTHSFISVYSLNYYMRYYLNKTFEGDANIFLNALILGNKYLMSDYMYEKIQNVGIGHLFVISGLHVNMILIGLNLVLKKLKNKTKFNVSIIFLSIYYLLTGFLVSVLRVFISYIISNNNYTSRLNSISKFCLNVFIVLLINPLYVLNMSFLLSYTIVFGIIIINKYLPKEKGFKSYFLSALIISINSIIISLPIVVSIGYKVNLASIIYNLFYIPFVSFIILPLSIITTIIPIFKFIYSPIIKFFLLSVDVLSQIRILEILFPKSPFFSFAFWISYFSIFIFKKIKIKRILIVNLLFVLLIWCSINNLKSYRQVYFLDVANGDSTVLIDKFKEEVIIIDTGDDIGTDLEQFLLSKSIKKISAIIITHGDYDHIGKLKYLSTHFEVENIYINEFDKPSISITNSITNINIGTLKCGDQLCIGSFYINVLWPIKADSNINNNSLVLTVTIGNTSMLMTGDIEQETEYKIIKNLKGKYYDILKIPHHGSGTSSTVKFLENIKFNYAIGMNGYSNKFGFPHQFIVDRYSKLTKNLYFTSQHGTVSFRINNKGNIYKMYMLR